MGPRAVRNALVALLVASAGAARADGDLSVTREEGLERCPDAVELGRIAQTFVVPSSAPPTHVYRVSFERNEDRLRAEIVDDTALRRRRLEDSGSECAPIAQAAAVVLATMWGSERLRPEPAPSRSAAGPAPSIAALEVRPRWRFSEGPALAVGLVRPWAAALRADAAVELPHASVGIGAAWLPEQRLDVPPGVVEVQLIAGDVQACALVSFGAELGLCADGFAGALSATGSGFTTNASKTRPWLAAGPEAFIDGPLLPHLLRFRVSAAAVIPLHAETFSISGVGTAYDTPAVGGLFSLTLEQVTR